MPVKRLNFYHHQFLREQDFKDEQSYHIEMRRLLNRRFHAWGIVDGLEVHKKEERGITIHPGMAIDGEGREIIVSTAVTRDLSFLGRDTHAYIAIAYHEGWDEADHSSTGGVHAYTRITETPEISEHKQQPQGDGLVITLARVHLNDLGHVHRIDMDPSLRKSALAATGAVGWLRLSFKPLQLSPVKIGDRRVKLLSDEEAKGYEFIVDEATAYCDERGARGSMDIPVPPGAKRVLEFRIAGTTHGKVTCSLFRTGWNLEENRAEKSEILREAISNASFHKEMKINNGHLDESHALAVSVMAEGETTICLVAARFE